MQTARPKSLRDRSITLLAPLAGAMLLVASPAGAQLAGDECTNAIPATVGENGPVSTVAMTPSANPPANEGCTYLQWNNSKDAWWVFNAPSTGRLTVEFCGSNFDTSIVLYRGVCGALTRIACDDDACAPGGPLYQSKVVDLQVPNGPVFIRVGGYQGATGQASFRLGFTSLGGVVTWGSGAGMPTDASLVSSLSRGQVFEAAITASRTVRCRGQNTYGQCNVPADLGTVVAVSAGQEHVVALTTAGTVRCWGANYAGQSSVPVDLGTVATVAAGARHTMALTGSGAVRCWGGNDSGQSTVPAGLGAVTAIDCGDSHSAVITASGTVRCWGFSDFGTSSPPSTLTAVAIAAGDFHTAMVTPFGTVIAWGWNASGQCNVPSGLSGVTAVAAGREHTVALTASGEVRCWGRNVEGQCSVPVGIGRAVAVTAGGNGTGVIDGRDCDANGVIDSGELPARDCNGNGKHDCWDAAEGTVIEDCDSNGIGDACEKQVAVSVSRIASPIGFGSPATLQIPGAAEAVSEVALRIRARGDFSSVLEHLRMRVGDLVDVQVLGGTGDCIAPHAEQVLTLSPDEFNRGIAPDGTWSASFVASSAVDAALCPGGTWLELQVSYTGATSADCDANAELDSCQIAAGTVADANGNGIIDSCESPATSCRGDLNLDGAVNGADLGALLGAWGSVAPGGSVADLNGDGAVNGADLGSLLGAWGPCTE